MRITLFLLLIACCASSRAAVPVVAPQVRAPQVHSPLWAPPSSSGTLVAMRPLTPPLAPTAAPAVGELPYASPPPANFRWGYFGAERHSQPAQWHYDFQHAGMRWKYCK